MDKYDPDYFIDFFSRIPEEQWICGKLHSGDKHCALGFLGTQDVCINLDSKSGYALSESALALDEILAPVAARAHGHAWRWKGDNVVCINDAVGGDWADDHPKHRIINALREAKALAKGKI